MRWSSTRPSHFRVLVLVAATVALWLPGLNGRPAAAETVDREFSVIVSTGVPVSRLTLEELRRIFLFKRTVWRPGQAVNILLPDGSLPARAFLLRHIYRMNDQELRRFILERIFQAEIDFAPKVVASDREAVSFVASGRSLIAVIAAGTAGLTEVRILRIDGKLAGEPGYPLIDK